MSRAQPKPRRAVSFDGIAPLYRWMEYASLGRQLERTREQYLPQLRRCRRALVLGDGDGRFLASLLRSNSQLHATAVDTSGSMLRLLMRRCAREAPGGERRVRPWQRDARELTGQDLIAVDLPGTGAVDLVATHFFLDCLDSAEVRVLAARLAGSLEPGGLWVVSEFQVPRRGPMRPLASLVVRGLYLAFGLLTGLRVRHLPDHASALRSAGLLCEQRRERLGGLLIAELWRRPQRLHGDAVD